MDKASKILVISPTPTHPDNAGNRQHIKLLSDLLKNHGQDVHFLYLEMEPYDQTAMIKYWGERLHIFRKFRLAGKGPLFPYYLRKIRGKLQRGKRFLSYLAGNITKNQFLYNGYVDQQVPADLKEDIQRLQNKHRFKVVVCEYAFLSKTLTYFEDDVYKILDTHDRFSDRFQVYLDNNLAPDWVSLYKDQEQIALQRADLVIALQESEREYFRSLTNKKVLHFFCFPEVEALPEKTFEKKLLYFASNNLINLKTLDYFQQEIFPFIKKAHPEVQLLVGGSISTHIRNTDPQVLVLGKFEDPADFYRLGDIVINPEIQGTGFKIKTLEALCYGMPVVCTRAGAAGLLGQGNDHLAVADLSSDFINALIEILGNETLRRTQVLNAKKWVKLNKERMSLTLIEHLKKSLN